MRKPIWCILGMRHNVWKMNPDAACLKRCSRCGRDGGILATKASRAATPSTGATSAEAVLVKQAFKTSLKRTWLSLTLGGNELAMMARLATQV